MSRIGKAPITVPSGVDINISGRTITVKGPKGSLSRVIPGEIIVRQEESTLFVERPNDDQNLRLALGFSHPVMVNAPDGISFEVPAQTRVIVKGIDKELVGQVAANIRSIRKPEPYKGKGVRYLDERIIRKAGKAGKK